MVSFVVIEVVLEVEWGLSTKVRSSRRRGLRLRLWGWDRGGWDGIDDDGDVVLLWVGLVPPFRGVWVGEVVVVELVLFPIFPVVEVPVVIAWTSEVVLDVEAFPFVLEAEVVDVVVVLSRPLVLRWEHALNCCPLDGRLYLVGVGLLLWVEDLDVVVLPVSGVRRGVVSIVPEMRVLVHWDSVWVKSPVPVGVAVSSVLVEFSIGSRAPCCACRVVEVIKDGVEVGLEGAASLDGGHPHGGAELLIEMGEDVVSVVDELEWGRERGGVLGLELDSLGEGDNGCED